MGRTLARKFDAVHKTTVASSRMIPIVCRQTRRLGLWYDGGLLLEDLRELRDNEESVGLSPACESSMCEVGTGKTKSSDVRGVKGLLIAGTAFSKMILLTNGVHRDPQASCPSFREFDEEQVMMDCNVTSSQARLSPTSLPR